jgi:hypothetical protein
MYMSMMSAQATPSLSQRENHAVFPTLVDGFVQDPARRDSRIRSSRELHAALTEIMEAASPPVRSKDKQALEDACGVVGLLGPDFFEQNAGSLSMVLQAAQLTMWMQAENAGRPAAAFFLRAHTAFRNAAAVVCELAASPPIKSSNGGNTASPSGQTPGAAGPPRQTSGGPASAGPSAGPSGGAAVSEQLRRRSKDGAPAATDGELSGRPGEGTAAAAPSGPVPATEVPVAHEGPAVAPPPARGVDGVTDSPCRSPSLREGIAVTEDENETCTGLPVDDAADPNGGVSIDGGAEASSSGDEDGYGHLPPGTSPRATGGYDSPPGLGDQGPGDDGILSPSQVSRDCVEVMGTAYIEAMVDDPSPFLELAFRTSNATGLSPVGRDLVDRCGTSWAEEPPERSPDGKLTYKGAMQALFLVSRQRLEEDRTHLKILVDHMTNALRSDTYKNRSLTAELFNEVHKSLNKKGSSYAKAWKEMERTRGSRRHTWYGRGQYDRASSERLSLYAFNSILGSICNEIVEGRMRHMSKDEEERRPVEVKAQATARDARAQLRAAGKEAAEREAYKEALGALQQVAYNSDEEDTYPDAFALPSTSLKKKQLQKVPVGEDGVQRWLQRRHFMGGMPGSLTTMSIARVWIMLMIYGLLPENTAVLDVGSGGGEFLANIAYLLDTDRVAGIECCTLARRATRERLARLHQRGVIPKISPDHIVADYIGDNTPYIEKGFDARFAKQGFAPTLIYCYIQGLSTKDTPFLANACFNTKSATTVVLAGHWTPDRWGFDAKRFTVVCSLGVKQRHSSRGYTAYILKINRK